MNRFFYFLLISTILLSCVEQSYEEPEVDLSSYQIEQGFELRIVASEPFIEAPVTLDFDDRGRVWGVEMKGYMQNLEGTGEQTPNGRIVILEDLDKDGVVDHSKVFLDSLVLPRAIAHVYGGLLYAEPPNLWFVDVENDKPINKTLVDAKYVTGGNVEHQPNGLMMNIDNWIYNAKSSFRYQRKNGKWIKQRTFFRGQWGISNDNYGRLYHNHNSAIIKGDIVFPNTFNRNGNYRSKKALGKRLTKNQRVYPLHATSVNRGYVKRVLNQDSVLVNVTASCSPLVYRGDKFTKNYRGDAFSCAPEANAIKRSKLEFTHNNTNAFHPNPGKEFVASTDEAFRPVTLKNSPDGTLYIVDMHRGILQDKAYLTPYLKKHYQKKQLDTVVGMGRILKIQPVGYQQERIVNLSLCSTDELVPYLGNANGWYRDKSQQLLIQRKDYRVVTVLKRKLLNNEDDEIMQIHMLHTLNGLDALSFEFLNQLMFVNNISHQVLSHAIILIEQQAHLIYKKEAEKCFEKLFRKNVGWLDVYLASCLGKWVALDSNLFYPILLKISNRYKNDLLIQEGVMSSLNNKEESFLQFAKDKKMLTPILSSCIQEALQNKLKRKKRQEKKREEKYAMSIKKGGKTFTSICATCHGNKGQGIASLAPPFIGSEYISGAPNRLASIILHGLSGPIHVNGKLYNLSATMPGLGNNPEFSNQDIQDVIFYLQDAFSNKIKSISLDQIEARRKVTPANGVFSESELLRMK